MNSNKNVLSEDIEEFFGCPKWAQGVTHYRIEQPLDRMWPEPQIALPSLSVLKQRRNAIKAAKRVSTTDRAAQAWM